MLMIPMLNSKESHITPLVNWINGPNDVKEGKYSLAICNLVLCDIESDEEASEVLKIISDSLEQEVMQLDCLSSR